MRTYFFLILFFWSNLSLSQDFSPKKSVCNYSTSIINAKSIDLDNDGDIDILNGDNEKLFWFENISDEEFFQRQVIYETPLEGIELMDVNNDGFKDILLLGYADLKYLKNLGNGSFGPEELIYDGFQGLITAYPFDLNLDGFVDIVCSSQLNHTISWIENNGDETFSDINVLNTSALFAYDVGAGDLNGDGLPDVISNSLQDNTISWYTNLGNGNFSSEVIISDAFNFGSNIIVLDYNNDNYLDIICTNESGGDKIIAVFENDGLANFQYNELHNISGGNFILRDLECEDIDSDGDLDFILAINAIRLIQNLGNGSFLEIYIDDLHSGALHLELADVNDDNSNDLIAVTEDDRQLAWYESNGLLFNEESVLNTQIKNPQKIFLSDIELDGDLDVFVAAYDDMSVSAFRNDGMGNFGTQTILSDDIQWVQQVSLADLTENGFSDLAYNAENNSAINWRPYIGGGNFGDVQSIFIGSNLRSFKIVDTDGDGDNDIIIHTTSAGNRIKLVENLGFGSFSTTEDIENFMVQINEVELTDMDGDGDTDIVILLENTNGIHVLMNLGNNNFTEPIEIFSPALGGLGSQIAITDIENDGLPEVVYSLNQNLTGYISYLKNLGNMNFEQFDLFEEEGFSTNRIEASDLDQDGLNEIIFQYSNSNNQISGLFALIVDGFGNSINTVQLTNSATQIRDMRIADIDSDNLPDIILSEAPYEDICWYENQSDHGCTDNAACNYDPDALFDNGSCCYGSICGCTNPIASNYDSDAICDDGSCVYSYGCLNPFADNYDPTVSFNNDSCTYKIRGVVFFDENENGIKELNEYGLAIRDIEVNFNNTVAYTNGEGYFQFPPVLLTTPQGIIEHNNDNLSFPFSTTDDPYSFDFENELPEINFGVSNEIPYSSIYVEISPPGGFNLCDTTKSYNIYFRNEGNYPIDGTIEFKFDELFQGYTEITPIDSIVGDKFYLGFENLLPSQLVCYQIGLFTPTVDYIGEILTLEANAYGYFDGQEIASGEEIIDQEHVCSYDPNDKSVFPIGYTDEHFVQKDSLLEFLIRFQNTGNAPAQNIWIRDTIDVNLDLNTFQLRANSHLVNLSLDHDTREAVFFFEDIQLPDSVNNEPESHGMVSYKIRENQGTPLLTTIENTAAIYFDNNPPIITNTTWSTTYDCSLFEVSFTDDGALLTASEGDSYQWLLNGDSIQGANDQIYNALESGIYSVIIDIDFPCSGITSGINVIVDGVGQINPDPILSYPNPAYEQIYLSFKNAHLVNRITAININGQMSDMRFEIIDNNLIRIERGSLVNGQYVLQVSGHEINNKIKIVVH